MSYQLPVLLYHRVVRSAAEAGKFNIYVTEKNLRAQLKYLKENNYHTITFSDLEDESYQKKDKPVILTFDDGYLDNYTILFPLLKEFKMKASIYLVTGCSRNEWDIRKGEPALELMNKNQIREMAAYGIEFGGHTQSHIDLKKASEAEQKKEIEGCKADVEQIIGRPALSFAYPFGAFTEETKTLVKNSGYRYAVSTRSGPFDWKEDLMQIRRIEVSRKTGLMTFRRKVSGNYFTSFSLLDLISSKK